MCAPRRPKMPPPPPPAPSPVPTTPVADTKIPDLDLAVATEGMEASKKKARKKLAKYSLSLPIDPNLTKKELNYIVKTLNDY